MIAFQSASLISSIGRPTWPTTPPAQLTRTSTRPMPSTRAVTCRGSARSAVSRSTRWTFAPSSASPSAMAVPMPCADPVTSATLPASSAILGPAVLDEIPDLGDAGAPELEDLFVGPLVRASEDPVDGEPAQLLRRRLTDEGGGDPRLCTFWHDDARDARPADHAALRYACSSAALGCQGRPRSTASPRKAGRGGPARRAARPPRRRHARPGSRRCRRKGTRAARSTLWASRSDRRARDTPRASANCSRALSSPHLPKVRVATRQPSREQFPASWCLDSGDGTDPLCGRGEQLPATPQPFAAVLGSVLGRSQGAQRRRALAEAADAVVPLVGPRQRVPLLKGLAFESRPCARHHQGDGRRDPDS